MTSLPHAAPDEHERRKRPAARNPAYAEADQRRNDRVQKLLQHRSGSKQSGDEIRFRCVYPGNHRNCDADPSASFNVYEGVWCCHACGAKGHAGGLLDLLDPVPSELMQQVRLVPAQPRPAAMSEPVPMVEVDCDCGRRHNRPQQHYELGTPSACWFYHDADGAAVACALRFEQPPKPDAAPGTKPPKQFRPFNLATGSWKSPDPRPLYRLDELTQRPDEPVVIVEGEKCADAVAELGWLATSVMGGAQAVGKADLTPLAGRTVYLWRDNDHAGETWLEKLRELLPAAGVRAVFVVPIPDGSPTSWDAADAVADGWDAARVHELIEAAESVEVEATSPDVFKRLKVVRATDLPKQAEAPDEVIEGILEAGTAGVIYGESNSGKTFFALSVADAVARGVKCYGRNVDAGLVVYLASEAPAGVLRRVQGLREYYGTVPELLYIVQKPLSFFIDDKDADAVVEVVRKAEAETGRPARLVIADTLARMASGADENHAKDMQPVILRFERVAAETKSAVLIVHHAGKDVSKGARGSSAIKATISTELEVEATEDFRAVHIRKARDEKRGPWAYFKLEVLELGVNKWGNPFRTCVAVEDPDAKPVLVARPGRKVTPEERKLEKFKKWIESAWRATGMRVERSCPFILRADLLRYLTGEKGLSNKTALNHLAPAGDNKLIGELTEAKVIEPLPAADGPGWRVVHHELSRALIMARDAQ